MCWIHQESMPKCTQVQSITTWLNQIVVVSTIQKTIFELPKTASSKLGNNIVKKKLSSLIGSKAGTSAQNRVAAHFNFVTDFPQLNTTIGEMTALPWQRWKRKSNNLFAKFLTLISTINNAILWIFPEGFFSIHF